MRYFMLMVLLITLATACIFNALLAGAELGKAAAGNGAQIMHAADDHTAGGSEDFHFDGWGSTLLQFCVIMLGADYGAFNALLQLPDEAATTQLKC
jgi:hypothetical protein